MHKIKQIRLKRGLRQIQVAEGSSITQAYLSEIESGKSTPSLSVLRRIAKTLGVAISDLLEEEGELKLA